MTEYVGEELDLFAYAARWKARLRRELLPFLVPPVLEVGGGIGATTAVLRSAVNGPWIALEPDPKLARRLGSRPELDCAVRGGDTTSLPQGETFATIIYVDVLEHIEDDRGELERAASHLAPGGRLVVLSPAHQWLFSPFDAAIGHHRRYSLRDLIAIGPSGCHPERSRYLDSTGLVLNLANRLVSRQRLPTAGQIRLWDGVFVPLSNLLDPLFGYRFGRSLLVVWKRVDSC